MKSSARTVWESVTSRGRIIRQGDIVCLIFDGGGSLVVSALEFAQAQKWANSKPPTGNMLTDRARFLDQISALVSRPNSMQPTRGNDQAVERIARGMRGAGYDLGEWTVPPEMKDPKYWMPKDLRKKKAEDPGTTGDGGATEGDA